MKNEYKIGLGISVLIAIIIAIIILTRKPSVPSGPSGQSVPSGPSGPAPSTVKITSEGIQFPKPSTTEGYMSEQVSCKKLQVLEPSAFENGNMRNGFSDYASYEAHRLEHDSKKWGENGWCKLSGFTDENQNALGYFYHEGDYNYGAFDMDTGKCKFTGDDKPYTCLYKEIKDGEFITGFENNDGKRLEVVFYNDYKAGKLDKWFESIGIGNRIKFILNNEGKLEVSINDPEKGSGSFVIKPGNNYPVQFMLLGTALAMVDNNIPMPETGLNIRFTSLNENDLKKNYSDELSKIISDLRETAGGERSPPPQKPRQAIGPTIPKAYIKFYTDCSDTPVNAIEIDRTILTDGEEITGVIKSDPGVKIVKIEIGNATILTGSTYFRYDESQTGPEALPEWMREEACANNGCEKEATVTRKFDQFYESGTSLIEACARYGRTPNFPNNFWRNIELKYKVIKGCPRGFDNCNK